MKSIARKSRLHMYVLLSLALTVLPCATTDRILAAEATPARGVIATNPVPERASHLTLLGVDQWHAAGTRGRGMKVAILDSGFRGYADYCGNVLPEHITTHSFRKDGNLEAKDSQHGILCAEVVHALAPEAELLFANWEPDDGQAFLQAVRWARSEGARVISCSVIMPSQSDGEGGGRAHEELTRILGPGRENGDVLLFASGGNTAQRHWAGTFHPNNQGFHEWQPGVVDNAVIPWGQHRVAVELCCKADSRYELQILDRARGTVVARSHATAGGSCAVHFQPHSGQDYNVRVRQVGEKAGPFHVVTLEAGLKVATSAGSVAFPADGPEVIAVGAVDREGNRAAYSACGSETCKSKPDLVAPVPFASSWRARPFAGTSAAAPQAAALATLVWSRHPRWAASRIRTVLNDSARDVGSLGPDLETGSGMIHLPPATAREQLESN